MDQFETNNAKGFRVLLPQTSMSAKATTGWGTGINVTQFTNVMFELLAANSANATVKVYVSYEVEEPTWTDPVSASNRYVPVGSMNLDTQAAIVPGSTGYTIAADGLTHYITSLQGAKWINFNITAISAGNISAFVTGFNNN